MCVPEQVLPLVEAPANDITKYRVDWSNMPSDATYIAAPLSVLTANCHRCSARPDPSRQQVGEVLNGDNIVEMVICRPIPKVDRHCVIFLNQDIVD